MLKRYKVYNVNGTVEMLELKYEIIDHSKRNRDAGW